MPLSNEVTVKTGPAPPPGHARVIAKDDEETLVEIVLLVPMDDCWEDLRAKADVGHKLPAYVLTLHGSRKHDLVVTVEIVPKGAR